MFEKNFPQNSNKGKALRELQGLKQVIVTGAAAAADILVPGIKDTDTIVGAVNLTDLTMVLAAAVKAELDCGTVGAGAFDTVLAATVAGADGNDIQVVLVGDSESAAGVSIDVADGVVTIHYETGVSTVGDVETAITALADADDIIAVASGGTGATVLATATDDFEATNLAGGLEAITEELPRVTEDGKIQFPNCDTANKKLLITYFVKPV